MSRYPDADMEQISISLRPETIQLLDQICRESEEHPQMWDMSRSEAGRELIQLGIEMSEEIPEIEELIDEGALADYERQKRHEERKREARRIDLRGGWRGRVRDRLDRRLAGEEPYPPRAIEELAESYWGDIEDLCDDPEQLSDHRRWLDHRVERYRRAYDSRQLAPDLDFSETNDRVALGSDMMTLRERENEFIPDLVGAIQSDYQDPDALVDRLAKDYAVDSEAVWTVLDLLSPEDVDERLLLSGDESRPLPESINPDQTELLDPEVEVDLLAVREPPEPDTPEPTAEIPTVDSSGRVGVSDGGISMSRAADSPQNLHDQDPEESPPEEMIEEAVEMIEEGVPILDIPDELVGGDRGEDPGVRLDRANNAVRIARERSEVNQ